MQTRRISASVLGVLISIAGIAAPAQAEHMSVVTSDEASKNAHVVTKGIKWHTSLEDARAQAKREGKLVFWMHMLGTIDGAT